MVKQFLEGNKEFVKNEYQANRDYYHQLSLDQKPDLLWIGCSDSRVNPSVITNSRPGEIFVHRNVANLVAFNDVNVSAVIEYAIKHLHIPDIVVCGHYGCGGIKALDAGIEDPFISNWLMIARSVKKSADNTTGLSPEERHRMMVKENVRLQLKHLSNFSLICETKKTSETPRLHGWVYDLETGVINVVE